MRAPCSMELTWGQNNQSHHFLIHIAKKHPKKTNTNFEAITWSLDRDMQAHVHKRNHHQCLQEYPRQHPARWSSVKPQKVDVSTWLYSSINIREGKNQKPRELHYHKVMREPISADWKSHQLLRKSPASIHRSNFKTIAWEFPYLSTHENILRQKTVDSKM